MPLRDLFKNTIDDRDWGPVYSAWTTMMAMYLNRNLPNNFVARPFFKTLPRNFRVVIFRQDEELKVVSEIELMPPTICRVTTTFKQIGVLEFELSASGQMPTIPLWLTETEHFPLDLEATYEETCRSLRIR